MNDKEYSETIRKLLQSRTIAYRRDLADIVGVLGAIMLSQAIYWAGKTKDPEGWFYKSRDEWKEETGLTRRNQETARKAFKKTGVVQEELRGNPARLYYRVDFYKLADYFRWYETSQLDGTKRTNKNGGIVPTIYNETETTTEITPCGENTIRQDLKENPDFLSLQEKKKANKAKKRSRWSPSSSEETPTPSRGKNKPRYRGLNRADFW